MSDTSQPNTQRDWVLFGLRWLYLLALGALALLSGSTGGATADTNNAVLLAVGVGVLANLMLALLLIVRTHPDLVEAVILLGDLAVVGGFVYISAGDPIMLTVAVGGVLFSGLLRPEMRWGLIHTGAVVAVAVIVVLLTLDTTPSVPVVEQLALPMLILIMLGAVALATSYGLEQQLHNWRRGWEKSGRANSDQVRELRKRARAIYSLSSTMGSTLNYEKVLEAALHAGQLGLATSERDAARLSAAVLLFEPDGSALHVVQGRQLTRNDHQVVIPGRQGVVAEALRDAVPKFATSAARDPELQYFAGFHTARSVMCVPLCAGFDNFGVLIYASDKQNAFNEEHVEVLAALGIQATIALQNALLYRNLAQEKERLIDVEEDARRKLARDLHDGPTQTVAAIAMRMSIIYKMLEREPDKVPEEIKKVEELARQTTKEIRQLMFALRPLVLESQGLAAALDQLAEKMQDTHNQGVTSQVEPGIERYLNHHQQGVLFYIIDEAVNNARKHAQAALIEIRIWTQGDVIVAVIKDNGVGFDVDKVQSQYENRSSSSLGMVNMRERVALLEGTLTLDSAVGKGTTITIVVPMHAGKGVHRNGDVTRPMATNGTRPNGQRMRSKLAQAAERRSRQR
ncbi:MAG: GAF domain-containing sensor histidine kinase [Chloroflexi bacterium]|nr:GAF domain-containing sensor histidine kinase [Chloroflexota bacterium]